MKASEELSKLAGVYYRVPINQDEKCPVDMTEHQYSRFKGTTSIGDLRIFILGSNKLYFFILLDEWNKMSIRNGFDWRYTSVSS